MSVSLFCLLLMTPMIHVQTIAVISCFTTVALSVINYFMKRLVFDSLSSFPFDQTTKNKYKILTLL